MAKKNKVSGTLKTDLERYAQSIAKHLAIEVRDELAREYEYVIERFYSEYTPKYYERHADRGVEAGLYRTFTEYYRNPHNTIYYGGIEISTENMYNDYHDSPADVLDSFLAGFHGRGEAGIYSSIQPYEHMMAYRDMLANHIDAFLPNALEKAKRGSFAVLKF